MAWPPHQGLGHKLPRAESICHPTGAVAPSSALPLFPCPPLRVLLPLLTCLNCPATLATRHCPFNLKPKHFYANKGFKHGLDNEERIKPGTKAPLEYLCLGPQETLAAPLERVREHQWQLILWLHRASATLACHSAAKETL
ncbi:hypothetical protein SRHO_G00073100 [Serrasalmus rhombeus]